jgi:hypothetical protein
VNDQPPPLVAFEQRLLDAGATPWPSTAPGAHKAQLEADDAARRDALNASLLEADNVPRGLRGKPRPRNRHEWRAAAALLRKAQSR